LPRASRDGWVHRGGQWGARPDESRPGHPVLIDLPESVLEDALVAHRRAREALVEQGAAVRASREALGIAELRYTSGLTNYLDVLDTQRTLLAAEVAESRTRLAQLMAVVQIYRALGGGWEAGADWDKTSGR